MTATGSALGLALVGLYVAVTLGLGWYGGRRTGATPREYFLAGGTLGRVVFPLSLFATLMSAFIFLGSAGFGYVHGLAWAVMIGIEAVAVVPLAYVGLRAWRAARAGGYVTPTELLGDAFGSDRVKLLVVVVQFGWAIPYVAIQAVGGGLLIETVSGGALSFTVGAAVTMATTAVYLGLGGLRGAAWSDVLQGVTVVVVLVAAAVFVLPAARAADVAAALRGSDLLAPAGAAGFFTPRVWLSFLLMNAMAIIAYPQMFQRFFAAEDERAFRALLGWWPVMAAVAAVVPVALGLVGTQLVPGLSTPDLVIPELLAETAPTWVLGLVVGGAVAAMMSTADSLVLTLSSMVTRDVYRDHLAGDDDGDESAAWATELRVSRASTAALLGGGFLLALVATGRAPGIAAVGTIVELAVYFIQGNALLLPVFLAALYWPAATRTGAVASVLLGQGYFLAGVFGPAPAFGFTPFVPALALAVAGLVAGSLLGPAAARSAPGAGADTRGGD